MKKRLMSGIACCSMLLTLVGCGSKEEAKDTTPQSAESTEQSSSKEKKVSEATIESPFNSNIPLYVTENDDENMNVDAVITPYLDTKDKVKVELYEDGDLDKTYIANYKIKEIQKGSKNHIPIYQYTFYENDSDEYHRYIATYINRTDLNNEPFIWIYPLNNDEKIPSKEQIKEQVDSSNGDIMTDNPQAVTLK